MNIYGYESEDGDLLKMQEITLQADADELKKLSKFIDNTIKLIEENGDSFGHEHFSDFSGMKDGPDIIIAK
ncbi:hypothetical protein [Halomonas binhaiensis]|uniref:Uncharacterized protein n=1 Tax=Halomonas binhaiensis TaxID=2562282 RepID=A0A5C1NJ39_9GAMM|nr:hypothetical protein [Halomonas binhaiensis]QEM82663.1 hypothetical protein E4T21_14740 [Halomonas binhaiensis]